MSDLNKSTIEKQQSMMRCILPEKLSKKLKNHVELTKILDNMLWLFFDKFFRLGLGFLIGVWFARYLGPEQFGKYSYALAFVGLFGAIAGLGLNSIVVRDIVRNPESATDTLGSALVMQVLASLLSITAINVAIFYANPDDHLTKIIVGVISITLIFKSIEVIKFWFESQVQSRYVVWIENCIFIFFAAIKISLILLKVKLLFFVWLNLAEAALTAIGLIIIYAHKSGSLKKWRCTLKRCKSLLRDSWPLLLSGIAIAAYMRIDIVMLQKMRGDKEVGIYAAATQISELWYFLPLTIAGSILPLLIKSHNHNMDLYTQRMRNLYFIMFWLSAALSLAILSFSEQIICIIFGDAFEQSSQVLSVHMLSAIAVFLGVASSQHLLAAGLQKISLYRTLIGMICNILLNLSLIPTMGAVGAAIATTASYFVATFSLVFFKETRAHAFYLLASPFHKTAFR